jgi:hypothetical protein
MKIFGALLGTDDLMFEIVRRQSGLGMQLFNLGNWHHVCGDEKWKSVV